ncbi:MAG: hypothetical protein ABJP34_05410 [Erythrobacter sp.]
MNKPLKFTANAALCAVLLTAPFTLGFATESEARTLKKPLAPPAGWSDNHRGRTRILTKNGITIVISPWTVRNGQTTRDWLKAQESTVPANKRYISTKTLQTEKAVAGSYSLLRTIDSGGQQQTSVLYACPGQRDWVRLMEVYGTVTRQTAGAFQAAAQFGEEVCRRDPNTAGASVAPPSRLRNPAASKPGLVRSKGRSSSSLAVENAKIPASNRPKSARIILEHKWKGFPAVRVSEAAANMAFANGYSTTCGKWNLLTQSPTPNSAGKLRRCSVSKGAGSGKIAYKFAPGETINVDFGRISGSSRDFGTGSSSSLSGGTLKMSKDGRIAIGKFNAFSASASGSGAGGGSRSIPLRGRYYLNGHTITIQGDNGRIYHGLIAASSDKRSGRYDNVFINGEHYWNRKK